MPSPLRGPKSPEGGGFAAAHPSSAPRRVRGRPSGLQGAAHRAGARQPRGLPWTPETTAAPGARKSGQAQACPALRAARKTRSGGRARAPGPGRPNEPAFDTGKEENLRYHSQTLESVKHHLKPNRQRSVGPGHRYGGRRIAPGRPGYCYSGQSNRAQMVRVVLFPSIPHSSATARTMSNPWCRAGSIIPWFQGPPLSWTSIRA